MTGARLILLDEPFAGVNPVLIEQLSERIRELHARGTGFLIIEHDLGALSRLVSTMHVMDRGAVIASGTRGGGLASPAVREAYLGGKGTGKRGMSLLEIRDLRGGYAEVDILNGIDLTLDPR